MDGMSETMSTLLGGTLRWATMPNSGTQGSTTMTRILAAVLVAATPIVSYAAPPARRAPDTPLRWTDLRQSLTLSGKYSSARLLVETSDRQGIRDISGSVRYSIASTKIARLEDGVLRPVANGRTVVTAQWNGATISLPVTVSGVTSEGPRFVGDVLPVLTRLGCNQGGCHGAAQGKGGFKLSMQGYDPESDIVSITRGAGGRRVSPARPEASLLLRKPLGQVPHKGGTLLRAGSAHHRLLVDWIESGMPGPRPDDKSVERLDVFPAQRTVGIGARQRFRVVATYSDKSTRDVSEESLFSGSDAQVASVESTGESRVVGKGEAAVLIRYDDKVVTATLTSPFAKPLPLPQPKSPRANDSDFLRRVTLDLTGTLPTVERTRAFLADNNPDKRAKLVDELLDSPEFVDNWTLRWGDILRSTRNAMGERGLASFNRWLRDSVATNKPWDTMTRELLLASGSTFDNGPANYFRAAPTPDTLVETTSQVFLGVRIQCAKCHNHPYEKWKQNQYYEMAAFFTRVRSKNTDVADEKIYYAGDSGDVANPRTKKTAVPTPLDDKPVPASFTGDRRSALVDWMTRKDNPFFAQSVVNRLWGHFLGQGIIEPVDDVRVTNPPSNPELLAWLASDFVRNRFDLKRTMRNIVLSETYQRSSIPTSTNSADTKYLSTFRFKRLPAEPLLDAIGVATGVPEKFAGYPVGMRASELPDATAQSYFLDLFGRPARNIVCQCERSDNPNLGQVLHFMNGKGINDRLTSKEGRIAQLVSSGKSNTEIVRELYLATLSREPELDEMLTASLRIHASQERRQGVEDILWVLLNSKEFVFNH